MRNGLYRSLPRKYMRCIPLVRMLRCNHPRHHDLKKRELFSSTSLAFSVIYGRNASIACSTNSLSRSLVSCTYEKEKRNINSIVFAQRCPVPFLDVQVVHSLDVRAFYLLATHDRINSIVHCRVRRRTRLACVTWFERRGIR
jgi:hypothetical protein